MTLTVSAPTRLHFGLCHVPVPGLDAHPDGTPIRKFGGLGLMIDEPRIQVSLTVDRHWHASGTLAERADRFARVAVHAFGYELPLRITADGPAEHTGLGVGTALGLAVARGVAELAAVDPQRCPAAVGRGKRSGIGVAGFFHGGVLYDHGKRDDDEPALVDDPIFLPTDWRILVIGSTVPGKWHGHGEQSAFDRPRTAADAVRLTSRLNEIAGGHILPAARQGNLPEFGRTLQAFNRLAGEPFVTDQGGSYASPEIADLIAQLDQLGTHGAGQSSWGPTIFAFVENEQTAHGIVQAVQPRLSPERVIRISRAATSGYRMWH